ncbi:MAG TPA: L-seryl-tRNA(Sec) selenium transferase [Thermoanaerobaculia bacterium]|nr:L-seryl-tRNA(Sec) selenium transferase [Thermoanaerobaculia bacterium]
MRKAAGAAVDSAAANFRSIPSVERLLSSPSFALVIAEFGRERVKEAVVAHLDDVRRTGTKFEEGEAVSAVTKGVSAATSSTLGRVVNGTGVIIHTNLGRSPIHPEIWREAEVIVTGYSNLEFDLQRSERGKRDEHLSSLCASLFGSEAAVLTNNNAAGTLLLLAAIAAKKEVIVSRGELVEIGGGFRVPEVIQQGGAKLHEVGTTNRTRVRDYTAAMSKKTAAILRVHRSNFDIVGFTETAPVEDLVDAAHAKKLPLLYDEGSGCIVDLAKYGFERSDTIRELIAKGVDAVTCSTDKLIGATQGGLILGREEIVAKCRRHPLMRALRAGKESYAVIGATLRAFATNKYERLIPIYCMLAAPLDELRGRARDLIAGTRCRIIDSRSVLGGGTTPAQTIPSVAVSVPGNATELHARFLAMETPILGTIENDVFRLDLRTVLEEELPIVREALG